MKHDRRNNKTRWRRKNRVRRNLRGSSDRPRLSVRRSNQHISCQLIDDETGATLASASTRDQSLRDQVSYGGNQDAAKAIGLAIAERGKAAGVTQIKFDRGLINIMVASRLWPTVRVKAGLNFNCDKSWSDSGASKNWT